jgi:hypothetical protein
MTTQTTVPSGWNPTARLLDPAAAAGAIQDLARLRGSSLDRESADRTLRRWRARGWLTPAAVVADLGRGRVEMFRESDVLLAEARARAARPGAARRRRARVAALAAVAARAGGDR